MSPLLEGQLKPYLHHSKGIEQFLGLSTVNNCNVFRWVEISYDKQTYTLFLHEVFDDREEGLESIYDFSYCNPDEQFGKELLTSNALDEILKYASQTLGANNSSYTLPGNLNEFLK